MHRSDSPFVADWFVVSFRWLVLLGATISLSLAGQLLMPGNLLLVLLTLWNISLTWLAGLNRRLDRHREISLAMDFLVTAIFMAVQGGILGPAAWVLLLPILTGAIYFDLRGGLITAGLVVLAEIAEVALRGVPGWLGLGIAALLTLAFGGFFGYISQQLIAALRILRQKEQEAREKAIRGENDRLRAVYNMTSSLTASLNYKRVLDSALDLSFSALSFGEADENGQQTVDARLACAVLLFKDDELTIGSARRFTSADLRHTFPAKAGLLNQVIEEGEPIVSEGIQQDPELSRVVSLLPSQSIYCFPMRSGVSVYGVMLFGHPQPGYFTPERTDILAILGRQAVIAIQNARLYQDLADEKERMAEAQEEARKKLARDLHDGPTQSVAAMAMRVSLARRMMEKDQKAASDELERIEDLARRTTKEIRHMLFTLRPLVLESQGLAAALESMAEKMKETYDQKVTVQVDDTLANQLEMGKSGVIFYIAEEAVNNARKHAQATEIRVRLAYLPKESEIAMLEIADNGVGFDVEAVNKSYDKRGSLGMVNLRERAELVAGLLQIDSTPGKGTRIRVFIPLTEEASDKMHQGRNKS